MKKKIIFATILLSFIIFIPFTSSSQAIECGQDLPDDPDSSFDYETYIDSCRTKIDELDSQQATLQAAIDLLNSKVNLTQAQIRSTTGQINKLEEEIQSLGIVIEDLNKELENLNDVFQSRVKAAYKSRYPSTTLMFFSSKSLNNFQNRLHYLQLAQRRDQLIMHELDTARTDYDEQKTTKEEKQAEIRTLQIELENQKNTLAQQRAAKKKILADTRNSEQRYQQLLSQAQAQLAAFSSFVSGQGGATVLSGQTNCGDWGCYYNQRDSQWANMGIGLSSSSMKEYGCLVTSMAMITSHYGKNLTPGQIAQSSNPFSANTAYMIWGEWTVSGVTTKRDVGGYSISTLDSELEAGRPVIVGLYDYKNPHHFIVIKDKKDGEYIMNDPFVENGYDMKFTDKYSISAIARVDKVTVQ